MFTPRPRQAIRQQREDPFREWLAMPQDFAPAVENGAQGEAIKQTPCYPNWSPSPGLRRRDFLRRDPLRSGLIRLQQPHQGIQMRRQQIFAAHVQDHALANLIALAVVLHQTQIFVPTIGGFDGAEEQELLLLHYDYSTAARDGQAKSV